MEPVSGQAEITNVTLIKEDDRESEQTYGLQLTFGDPPPDINAATLQQVDQVEGFDYVVRNSTDRTFNVLFLPSESVVSFTWFVVPDDLVEGTEGFRVTILSQEFPFPNIVLPSAQDPAPYPDTLIRIQDIDRKFRILFFLFDILIDNIM